MGLPPYPLGKALAGAQATAVGFVGVDGLRHLVEDAEGVADAQERAERHRGVAVLQARDGGARDIGLVGHLLGGEVADAPPCAQVLADGTGVQARAHRGGTLHEDGTCLGSGPLIRALRLIVRIFQV